MKNKKLKLNKVGKIIKNYFSHPVAQKYPLRSFYRLLFFHLRGIVKNSPKLYETLTGTKIWIYKGHHGSTGYYYFDLPDYEEQLFSLDMLEKGDLFVDIGANIGGWSILLSGTGAKVKAFEPVPSTYELLQENIKLNEKNSNIEIYQLGISSSEGYLNFTADLDTGNHVLHDNDYYKGLTQMIQVKRLNDIIDEIPKLIKIDVEGHELEVLKGADKILSNGKLKAIIIETFRWANYNHPKLRQLEDLLSSYGFLPCGYNVKNKKLEFLKKINEGGQNTIYSRKELINNYNKY